MIVEEEEVVEAVAVATADEVGVATLDPTVPPVKAAVEEVGVEVQPRWLMANSSNLLGKLSLEGTTKAVVTNQEDISRTRDTNKGGTNKVDINNHINKGGTNKDINKEVEAVGTVTSNRVATNKEVVAVVATKEVVAEEEVVATKEVEEEEEAAVEEEEEEVIGDAEVVVEVEEDVVDVNRNYPSLISRNQPDLENMADTLDRSVGLGLTPSQMFKHLGEFFLLSLFLKNITFRL